MRPTVDRNGAQVWVHPPALRTLLCNGRPMRLSFPWTVAWWYKRRLSPTPHMYLSMTEPRLDADDAFISPPLPNLVSMGTFCMGSAGDLRFDTPLAALLFSSFGGDDHKIDSMMDWARWSRWRPDEWADYPVLLRPAPFKPSDYYPTPYTMEEYFPWIERK